MRPYLVHNGVAMTAFSVGYLTNARWLADPAEKTTFEIADIEPGDYSLYWMTAAGARPDHCVSGVLPQNGSLSLSAPSEGTK